MRKRLMFIIFVIIICNIQFAPLFSSACFFELNKVYAAESRSGMYSFHNISSKGNVVHSSFYIFDFIDKIITNINNSFLPVSNKSKTVSNKSCNQSTENNSCYSENCGGDISLLFIIGFDLAGLILLIILGIDAFVKWCIYYFT